MTGVLVVSRFKGVLHIPMQNGVEELFAEVV